MKHLASIHDCCIIELNKINNRAGNITFIEGNVHIPFVIKRVYYLYDVPGGSARGGHAHKELIHFLIAASGCFEVILDDGMCKKVFDLNRPYYGLLVYPGIWSELINFSSGGICLVVASEKYDPDDYIRDYDKFLIFRNENSSHF
jgi:hypothetical protein